MDWILESELGLTLQYWTNSKKINWFYETEPTTRNWIVFTKQNLTYEPEDIAKQNWLYETTNFTKLNRSHETELTPQSWTDFMKLNWLCETELASGNWTDFMKPDWL